MKKVLWRQDLELDKKGPRDVLLIEIDWSDRVGIDPVNSADVTAQNGLTATVDSFTSTTSVLKLSAGVADRFYIVTAIIDTAGGQHFERSFVVPVAEL